MSKIYEALESAQQESRMLQKTKVDLPRTTDALPVRTTVEMDLENEMVALYQSIESQLPSLDRKVIQFVSAREGEGTSTIVREFARIAAKKLGKLVLMLDSSSHTQRKCLFLHITPECGWEEVTATGAMNGSPADRSGMDVEMCPPEPMKGNGHINFYSPAIADFWQTLKDRYDLVLIDSSPASASPDGIEISRAVDGVVIIVEAEKTRWQIVENLKQRIESRGGNILGVVFNKRRYYIPDSIYRRL